MREDLRVVEPDAEQGCLCAVLDESGQIHRISGKMWDLLYEEGCSGSNLALTKGLGYIVLTNFTGCLFPEDLKKGEDWFETFAYSNEPPECKILADGSEKLTFRAFYDLWAPTVEQAMCNHRRVCRWMRKHSV